jgi:predicted dehydrogenase
MVKSIVTALASYGMSGEVFHAPVISAHYGFNLKYILERTQEKSKGRYPNATIVRSFDEILNNPSIELVIVNTPNPLHYSMTKNALLAGKHVVVEKPFTVTVAEGVELIELAKKKNLVLGIFHNKRLEGEFKTVTKIIKEGSLGTLELFETHFDRHRPDIGPKKWKEEENPGAGLLYDLGPHMIDQALVLFGMPLEVDADLQIQREGGKVVDYFKIKMMYHGFVAIVTAGMLAKEPVLKYYIKGDKGTFTKYGNDPQEGLLKLGHSPLEKNWGVEPENQWGTVRLSDGSDYKVPTIPGTYLEYYNSIYESIRNRNKLIIEAEEALNTIKIIEAAIESNLKNKPVQL